MDAELLYQALVATIENYGLAIHGEADDLLSAACIFIVENQEECV